MLKVNNQLKILLILAITLITICIFNINTVNAQEETSKITDMLEIAELIPDTVDIDMLESEAIENDVIEEKMSKEVMSILESKNVDITGLQISITGSRDGFWERGRTIRICKSNSDLDLDFDIGSHGDYYFGQDDDKIYIQKFIEVKYSNTDKWNEKDAKYVESIMNDIKKLKVELNNAPEMKVFENDSSSISKDYETKEYLPEIQKSIKDKDIKINVAHAGGEWTLVEFFYKDVYYCGFDNLYLYPFTAIIVPDSIEDTEEAYIQYAMPKLKKILYIDGENIELKKVTDKFIHFDMEGVIAPYYKNDGTFYSLTVDGEEYYQEVIIKKENHTNGKEQVVATDSNTDVKLEASTDVIPSNTILEVETLKEGEIYNNVKTILSNIDNFIAFDITLKSNGVAIQPNGKVKISIPIPEKFNAKQLVIYRIQEDGTKIEYDVSILMTEDNKRYAQFETDHFSTYVLAEKPETETTTTTTESKEELDETPKTGIDNEMINIFLLGAVVSLVSIVVIKKYDK